IWSEKLDRDVYLTFYDYSTLYEDWGEVIEFSNIGDTEQKHMNRLIAMLNNHTFQDVEIPIDLDPTLGYGPGEFEDTDLQELYDGYVLVVDLAVALQAGITIENSISTDYTYYKGLADPLHVFLTTLYGNLLVSSDNHLLVFTTLSEL
ncbi:MAG: DUF2202 domain-containing protein, partial [Ignavibacteriaceae bacterium]|nr:DUF2202 domain-containing protein [Ignavibacteriaceae bacterium]